MRDRLGATPVPIHVPIGSEEAFAGIVDLVDMRAVTYTNALGTELSVDEIPEELAAAAEAGHHALIDGGSRPGCPASRGHPDSEPSACSSD